MVDTRDINLLGNYKVKLVTNDVTKTLSCDKNCDKLVMSNFSKNKKKVISFNEL